MSLGVHYTNVRYHYFESLGLLCNFKYFDLMHLSIFSPIFGSHVMVIKWFCLSALFHKWNVYTVLLSLYIFTVQPNRKGERYTWNKLWTGVSLESFAFCRPKAW